MELYRYSLPQNHVARRSGSVVTIGAYDGLHLGHQRILAQVRYVARERSLTPILMSFEPTPKEYFSPDTEPARLMRLREKFQMLQTLGVEVFFCPRFDASMAAIEPHDFARRLLAEKLNARHVVVGDDFRYAHRRRGTLRDLMASGHQLGFDVSQVGSVRIDGRRVSSTATRDALKAGDLALASRFLGRPYRMSGRVIEGKRLGRQLGFPTANVAIHRRVSPVQGIYAVRVAGLGDSAIDGVASIGTRPTVDNGAVLLEVHLFDFDREIYGRYVHVDFVEFLRAEVKFPDLDALIEQMRHDAAEARRILQETSREAGE